MKRARPTCRYSAAAVVAIAAFRLAQGNAAEALVLVAIALVFAIFDATDAVREVARRPATVLIHLDADNFAEAVRRHNATLRSGVV